MFFSRLRDTERATGIIWVGPVFNRGGYGNVSRNYVLGLTRLGVPVRVVDIDTKDEGLPADTVRTLKKLKRTDVGAYPVGVVHYEPPYYPGVRFRNVVKTIGCTIFETDRIPAHWVPFLNNMDEVWVPSRFNYDTFSRSGVDAGKIRIIPYSVDTDYYKPITDTFPLTGKKGFSFLYVFEFGWRKGFDILLEAYGKEFTASDDVTLILKVYGGGQESGAVKKRIVDSVRGRINGGDEKPPHVMIMDAAMSQDDLRLLYNTCDVYISTERASGWGMPCMEAMAMGKPAAALDWGGSTEFMNDTNSLLIKAEDCMVPVDHRLSQGLPKLYGGHQWPDVRVEEIRRVLRFAYEQRNRLKEIALKGMEDVRQQYSLTRVAQYIQETLVVEKPNPQPWYSLLLLRQPGVHVKGLFRRKRRNFILQVKKKLNIMQR